LDIYFAYYPVLKNKIKHDISGTELVFIHEITCFLLHTIMEIIQRMNYSRRITPIELMTIAQDISATHAAQTFVAHSRSEETSPHSHTTLLENSL
jgi:hypothetical protein